MNKKFIIPLAALGFLAIVGTSYFGIAKAAENNNNRDNMVQQLAQKLGLDQTKIQTAMDEIRAEHQAVRKAEVETNLEKAVNDKVITAEQKQKLLEKMTENQAEKKQQKGEMRQWAQDNGIDMSKLKDYGFGKGPQKGMGPRSE